MLSIRRRQEELLAPLIRARRARRDAATDDGNIADEDCYADSLLSLRIPEDGVRNLTESEMVCLCSEFLTSTTDSTAAVTQWIMAHLVAQPEIQAKLGAEIHHVVTGAGAGVDDEHLRRMPYLRAVVHGY
jgi:cytochrome P450 family 89 subfamily A